ncbi:MAG: 1,4-dihydroxy-2-naphthoate polyprenyltransferase [Opitutales bacterium]
MRAGKWHIWLSATRPKTLPAAVCPVLVGSSLAYESGSFAWVPALLCLGFALLIQVGTNFANDYLDGIKGTDTKERIGPQRAVANGWIEAAVMRRAAIAVLAAAFCLGLGLIPFGGWWLLVVGIASVVCAWLYTGGPYPLAYHGLGDVFVVLFFGFVAVGCTYFVQSGMIEAPVLWAGLACGLLVNNILVVNNYRDRAEDSRSGKKTLAVVCGGTFVVWQFRLTLVLVAALSVYLARVFENPRLLLTLLALLPACATAVQLPRLRGASAYLRALKISGLVVAAYGLVFFFALIP